MRCGLSTILSPEARGAHNSHRLSTNSIKKAQVIFSAPTVHEKALVNACVLHPKTRARPPRREAINFDKADRSAGQK